LRANSQSNRENRTRPQLLSSCRRGTDRFPQWNRPGEDLPGARRGAACYARPGPGRRTRGPRRHIRTSGSCNEMIEGANLKGIVAKRAGARYNASPVSMRGPYRWGPSSNRSAPGLKRARHLGCGKPQRAFFTGTRARKQCRHGSLASP
jgi:hypothetical protein